MINSLFDPKSIAIIGATDRERSVGRGIIENLKSGNQKLYFINTTKEEVFGEKTYSKITDVESGIDLAIIAIPKDFVLPVVDDCIKKRVGGVIIISSGFAEVDESGEALQKEISRKLSEADIPFVGPNCLGILRPPVGLNASFAPSTPKDGSIALISQSGGLIDALIDGSFDQAYGFSLIISVGNAAGLTIADYIKFADEDSNTKVITIYVEGINNGRELVAAVKNANKPILFIKGGKEQKSLKAISSHTGSLAGEYAVFSAIMKHAGAIEVSSLEEMLDVAKALSWQKKAGSKIGIVTNGGGVGVLLTDLIYKNNLQLAKTEKQNNPSDVLGDAPPSRYADACRKMLEEDVDQLVVIQTPQAVTEPFSNSEILVALKEEFGKPITTIFMGGGSETRRAIRNLEDNEIPNYTDPKRAIKPLTILTKIK